MGQALANYFNVITCSFKLPGDMGAIEFVV